MRCRAVLLSVGLVALCAPASAAAAPTGSATMFSERGDYIGGGVQRTYDTRAGDRVSASASNSSLGVSVSGGPYGDSYSMEFVAPDGQALQPGVYVGAQRAPFHESSRPGIEVSGDGRGCNEIAGSFEVRDLTRAPDGSVQSAWVVYEQHCEGGTSALFGEVRIGDPAPAVAPSLVRWPALDSGGGGQAVPVWFTATAPITKVAIEGDAAADYAVRIDDCTGAGPGRCDVWVRFVPTAPGTRTAWLRTTDATGARTDVPLQGFDYGGTTGLTMKSDTGDYIGGGATLTYGPDSSISVGGSRSYIGASVDGVNGDWWDLDFEPAAGDVLAPGTYTGATRYPFNGSGPGLSVSGTGRGCNQLDGSFTVNELRMDGGDLHSLSISFEQHCEHATAALRGTLSFRAGDTTQPAPWMVAGGPTAIGGPPPAATARRPPRLRTPARIRHPPRIRHPHPRRPPRPRRPRPTLAPQTATASTANTALTVERQRVAASSHTLLTAKPAKLRTAAIRLAAALERYGAAVKAAKPANARVLSKAIERQAAAVRALRSALKHGSTRERKRALKQIAASDRALAAAARA